MSIKSVMVIGDNPINLMEEYNINKKVEKYLIYKASDAKKLYETTLSTLRHMIETLSQDVSKQSYVNMLSYKLMEYEAMTDVEYFSSLTQDYEHDEDGNAWSIDNPNGKWIEYKPSDKYSLPLILKDGNITHQAKKKDIDWDKMHLANVEKYISTWQITQCRKEPSSEEEKRIKEVMKDYAPLVAEYKTQDNYVKYNSSYWNYAVISNNGWEDVENKNSFEWVISFFKNFVEPLRDDDLITIFEYQSYD
jgi:hypothetical protein